MGVGENPVLPMLKWRRPGKEKVRHLKRPGRSWPSFKLENRTPLVLSGESIGSFAINVKMEFGMSRFIRVPDSPGSSIYGTMAILSIFPSGPWVCTGM